MTEHKHVATWGVGDWIAFLIPATLVALAVFGGLYNIWEFFT